MAEHQFEISQGAGIVRDSQGFAFIPATQRPDGSWRKPRRVKDGYVPDEDVERYKNRAVRSRENAPACPGLSHQPQAISVLSTNRIQQQATVISPEHDNANLSRAAKKNLRRKEQRQKKKDEFVKSSISMQYQTVKAESSSSGGKPLPEILGDKFSNMTMSDSKSGKNCGDGASDDVARKIKNLKKKLRQISDLKEKIDSGVLTNPDKTQLEKIAKEPDLMEELKSLES